MPKGYFILNICLFHYHFLITTTTTTTTTTPTTIPTTTTTTTTTNPIRIFIWRKITTYIYIYMILNLEEKYVLVIFFYQIFNLQSIRTKGLHFSTKRKIEKEKRKEGKRKQEGKRARGQEKEDVKTRRCEDEKV